MNNINAPSPEAATGTDNYFRNTAIGYLVVLLFYSFIKYMTVDSEPNTTAENLLYWIVDRFFLVSFATILFIVDKRISHQKFNDQEIKRIKVARILSLFYAMFFPIVLVITIPIALYCGITGTSWSWLTQKPTFDYVYYSLLAICFILSLISVVILLNVTKSKQEPLKE